MEPNLCRMYAKINETHEITFYARVKARLQFLYTAVSWIQKKIIFTIEKKQVVFMAISLSLSLSLSLDPPLKEGSHLSHSWTPGLIWRAHKEIGLHPVDTCTILWFPNDSNLRLSQFPILAIDVACFGSFQKVYGFFQLAKVVVDIKSIGESLWFGNVLAWILSSWSFGPHSHRAREQICTQICMQILWCCFQPVWTLPFTCSVFHNLCVCVCCKVFCVLFERGLMPFFL